MKHPHKRIGRVMAFAARHGTFRNVAIVILIGMNIMLNSVIVYRDDQIYQLTARAKRLHAAVAWYHVYYAGRPPLDLFQTEDE